MFSRITDFYGSNYSVKLLRLAAFWQGRKPEYPARKRFLGAKRELNQTHVWHRAGKDLWPHWWKWGDLAAKLKPCLISAGHSIPEIKVASHPRCLFEGETLNANLGKLYIFWKLNKWRLPYHIYSKKKGRSLENIAICLQKYIACNIHFLCSRTDDLEEDTSIATSPNISTSFQGLSNTTRIPRYKFSTSVSPETIVFPHNVCLLSSILLSVYFLGHLYLVVVIAILHSLC